MAAVRASGHRSLEQVGAVVLETDGRKYGTLKGHPMLLGVVLGQRSGSNTMIRSLGECRNKKFLELLYWWQNSCPGNGLPLRCDFDPLDHPKLWPQMFICDVIRNYNNQLQFVYRYAGGKIDKALEVSCTGRFVDDPLIENNTNLINEQFEECINGRRPIYCWHQFITKNGLELEFERIILPISRHSDTADSIIGAYEFSKAWVYTQKNPYNLA